MGEGNELILEVETDRDGRVVITLDEHAGEPVAVPSCCATCLKKPAVLRRPSAMVDIAFPYCAECSEASGDLPPARPRWAPRLLLVLMLSAGAGAIFSGFVRLRSWMVFGAALFLVVGLPVLVGVLRESARRRQCPEGVELLLSESHTIRFAFVNPEYARRFLEANGADSGDVAS